MHKPTQSVIESRQPAGLGRREFLLGTAGAFFVTACQCGETVTPPPEVIPDAGVADAGTQAPANQAFRAWEQMREAARQSPDHLSARADAAVATKDAQQIYLFVRDQITTVPAEKAALGDHTQLRYGARGALRSGTGSMRDKAELLAGLLTEAGFEAGVYFANITGFTVFVERVLKRRVTHSFAPAATPEQLAEWQQILQRPQSTGARPTIDGAAVDALADQLIAALPATVEADPFSPFAPLYQPLVRVVVDGTAHFLNVNLPDLPFGETSSTTTPAPAPAAVPPPNVKVSLQAAITGRATPTTLVSAELPALELIGRSLFAGFTPVEDFPQLAGKRLGELRTFIPSLVLRSPGMSAEQGSSFTWVGDPITLTGEVMQVQGDQLLIRGVAFDTSQPDPARASLVQSLDLAVNSAQFPEVRLRVQAGDGSGGSVVGLPASAFDIHEDGVRMPFTLLENAPPAPRVLFVLDRSTSMPAEFRDAGAGQLLQNVATDLLARDPRCEFRVHIIDGDINDGSWTQDPAALALAAQNQPGSGSNLWQALALAADLNASTVVMITDGAATDSPTAEAVAAISFAPPSLFLQVLTGPTEQLDQMAALTSGKVLSAMDHTAAANEIDEFLKAREHSIYLLRYRAPAEGPSPRNVQLSLRGASPMAMGSYTPPPVAERAAPARIGGLLLTLEAEDEPTLSRLWAGTRQPAADAPEALFEEVEGAFFGTAELHFEGGPPTVGTLLDDWLSTRLEHEPVLEALAAPEATIDQLQQAFTSRPPRYHLGAWIPHVALAEPSETERLHRTGLRAAMYVHAPRFGAPMMRKLDLFPWGNHRTIADDPRRRLEATVRATARLALMEKVFFDKSTASELEGAVLRHFPPGQSAHLQLMVTPELTARWQRAMQGYESFHRLLPQTGTPVAFWVLDRTGGEVLGVLESGGGAGETSTSGCDLNGLLDGLDRLGSLAGAMGALGSAAGTWYSLEITKARKLLAATVVISGGTPTFTDPADWRDFFGGAVCGAAGAAMGAGLNRLMGDDGIGVAAGVLNDILEHDGYIAAATGSSIVCDPGSTGSGGC